MVKLPDYVGHWRWIKNGSSLPGMSIVDGFIPGLSSATRMDCSVMVTLSVLLNRW